MKKTILKLLSLAVVACLYGKPFFLTPELKTYGTFAFTDQSKHSFTGGAGIFAKTPNLEFRTMLSFPKKELLEINNIVGQKDFSSLSSSPRSSFTVNLLKDTTPFTLSVGSVGLGRSVSRLKNPVPNLTSTPLTKNFYFSSGISASLPTLYSAKKPNTMFCQVDLSKTRLPFMVQVAMDEEKSAFFSTGTKINFSKHIHLQANLTTASTYIENNSSYLVKNKLNFKSTRSFATSLETNFSSPFLKLNASIGLHQSPYDKTGIWLNTKARTAIGPFLLDAGYFAITTTEQFPKPVPFISADSSITKTCEQFFINPQFLILQDKSSIRFGTAFSQTWKIAGTKEVYSINPSKISVGALYEKKDFSLLQTFSVSNLVLTKPNTEKPNLPQKYYEASLTATKNYKSTRTDFKSSCKLYQKDEFNNKEEKQIYSTSLKSYLGKTKNFSLFGTYNSTYKGFQKDKAVLNTGGSFKIKTKYHSTSLKCTFNLNL